MRTHSGKYNLMMVYVLQASGFLFPLITYPYITRTLGSANLGTIGFASSVSSYFAAVATFGMFSYAVRTCSRLRGDRAALQRTAMELLTANSVTTLLAVILFAGAVMAVPGFRAIWPYLLLSGVIFATDFLGVSWFYTAMEQFDYITLRTISFKCLSLLLIFILIRNASDSLLYAGILAFSAVGTNLLNFLYARELLGAPIRLTRGFSCHYAATGWFFIQSVSLTIFSNMDVTMMGFVSTAEQIGNYEAALKLKLLLTALVSSLGNVFLPRLSRQYKEQNMHDYWNTAHKSLRYACFVSLPIIALLWICGDEMILLFCGAEYVYAGTILKLLGAAIFFIGVSTVSGTQLLLSMGKQKQMLLSLAVGCLLNFVMNLWLIPLYQGAGAAFSTVCAELFVVLVQLLCLWRMQVRLPLLDAVKKPLCGVGLSTACVLLLQRFTSLSLFWSLAVTGLVFAAVYIGVLWVIREPILCEMMEFILRKGNHERK